MATTKTAKETRSSTSRLDVLESIVDALLVEWGARDGVSVLSTAYSEAIAFLHAHLKDLEVEEGDVPPT